MCVLLLAVSLVIAVILIVFVIFLPNKRYSASDDCRPSITSASGSAALTVCSGSLIFVENFNRLDKNKWQPEVTLSGGSVSEICLIFFKPKQINQVQTLIALECS